MSPQPHPKLIDSGLEEQLVGCCAVYEEAWPRVSAIIGPGDLAYAPCKRILEAVNAVHQGGAPLSPETILEVLDKRGTLGEVEGESRLGEIMTRGCLPAQAPHFARQVKLRSLARQFAALGDELSGEVLDVRFFDEMDLHRWASTKLETFVNLVDAAALTTVPSAAGKLADLVLARKDAGDEKRVPTGFRKLNRLIAGGFRPGQLVVVGGLRGVGKSTFCGQIALDAARRGSPVLYVSLEMPEQEVVERLLANLAEVPALQVASGDLSQEPRDRLGLAGATLQRTPLYIVARGAIHPAGLDALVASFVKKHGVEMVFVDHLGLLTVPGVAGAYERVSEVSRALKCTAMRRNVVVVAASQLSRAAPDRGQPQAKHLRDSGSVEQDSDIVVLLWKKKEGSATLEASLAKNRGGPSQSFSLDVDLELFRVRDPAPPDPGPVTELLRDPVAPLQLPAPPTPNEEDGVEEAG